MTKLNLTAGKKHQLLVLFLLAVILVQAASSIREKSMVWDEDMYLRFGYKYLKTGSVRHGYDHAFAVNTINAIPLLIYDKPFKGVYNSGLNADEILFNTRFPTILLTIILGVYVYTWAKRIYSPRAGLVALTLYSFSPNILAHGRLATSDLHTTALMFISAYYFWNFMKTKTIKNSVYMGASFGLALTGKQTILFLIPAYGLLVIYDFINARKQKKMGINGYLRDTTHLIIIAGIAGILIFSAAYGFRIENLKQVFWGAIIKYTLVDKGESSYLIGKYSDTGFWYYYPIAYLIKTPLPALLMLIGALVYYKRLVQNPRDEAYLIIPVILLFLFFTRSHLNIGLRYVLPVYPFIHVFTSKMADIGKASAVKKYVLLALIGWYIICSVSIHPHYLAYFNVLVGGPDNGHRYLTDSNIDWGQDLKGLKNYMDENRIDKIKLAYFGTASIEYHNISYEHLPTNQSSQKQPEGLEIKCGKTNGILAISATTLSGTYLADKNCYQWLDSYEPVHKIGYSVFIYNITE